MSGLYTYRISSNGKVLSPASSIQSILIFNDINRIPAAKIILRDGEVSQQNFELSSEDLFIPGREIEISLGTTEEMFPVFKGLVIGHEIKVTSQTSTLELSCKHKISRMAARKTNHVFHDTTDLDAIYTLLNANEIEFETSSLTSINHQQLVHYNSFEWDFICSRAEANGLLIYFEADKLHFATPKTGQTAAFKCTYGLNVVQFNANLNAQSQFDRVESKSWSPANQQVSTNLAEATYDNKQGNLATPQLSKVLEQSPYALFHSGSLSDPELLAWGQAKANKSALAKIEGNVRILGTGKVKTGDTLELAGFGDRFNGMVLVTGIRHEFSGGSWTMDIQFGLSDRWFAEREDFNALPAGGLMPAVNGLQVAKVLSLEDPEGQYRIKVAVPLIDVNADGVWARIVQLNAGQDCGTVFLPEIDDEVIIGFLNDDPRYPIVIGSVYSSAHTPPIDFEDKNKMKGYISRSKLLFKFDEEKKSVQLSTPGGYEIIIDEQGSEINIRDPQENKITINQEGISLTSSKSIHLKAQQDILIEGMAVKIKATGNLEMEGTGATKMASSGMTSINGSLVTIN